jgi:hypothetical protein
LNTGAPDGALRLDPSGFARMLGDILLDGLVIDRNV